jgi:hypothetical protein
MPRLKAHVIAMPERQAVPAFDVVYCLVLSQAGEFD